MAETTFLPLAAPPPQSYGRRVVGASSSTGSPCSGCFVLVLLALSSSSGRIVSPYTFDGQDFNLIGSPGPMIAEHWLGTDELGRDALTRLIYGGRVSLAVGLAGAIIATLVGTLVGALSGFYRGWIDTILMRFTDVMLSIPTLPLVLLLSGLFRPSPPLLVAIVGALIWMGTARLVRSQFLALARARIRRGGAGARGRRRAADVPPHPAQCHRPDHRRGDARGGQRHHARNRRCRFLGFGIQPPVPTWGNLLNSASSWLSVAPWLAIPPGLCILCHGACGQFRRRRAARRDGARE